MWDIIRDVLRDPARLAVVVSARLFRDLARHFPASSCVAASRAFEIPASNGASLDTRSSQRTEDFCNQACIDEPGSKVVHSRVLSGFAGCKPRANQLRKLSKLVSHLYPVVSTTCRIGPGWTRTSR